jgi:hypothetical protein
MSALRKEKDKRKLQYSRSNILGFINTGYFTSNNVPDGIKNATHNTFSNFRKSWLLKLNIQLFSEMAKHKQEIIYYVLLFNARTKITSVSFSMFVIRFLRHALTSQI